ncbi:MAG: GDP-L-fucose synthase family protein [Nitrospiraceae bacterium]
MGYWDTRRVLVTGGAGFLGGAVVEKLRARGCREVIVPRSREYNLVEGEAVRRLYQEAHPDLVIHLAARVGGIGANRDNPARFLYENLMMGVQVIEEAYRAGIQKCVAIGTVCAYPKFTPVPFSEQALWDGYPEETNAPYGLAKKMLLVQCQAYRLQDGFNAIYLLPANLYGPRESFDLQASHVIPAVIRKCVEAVREGRRRVDMWGTGNATREFLYVDDAAEGILLAAERYNKPAPVNLGSGAEISIAQLVHKIANLAGFSGEIHWDASKPDGQPRRCLDVSRAEKEFGFRASVTLDEGLRRTIEWYREQGK